MTKAKTKKREPPAYHPMWLSSSWFEEKDFPREWLVEQILVDGQPGVIGGPKKGMKTSIAIDLAVSLASGTPFLGVFAVPMQMRVGVISGESGGIANVQETAQRICKARNITLPECAMQWSNRLPNLDCAADRMALTASLREHSIRVVLIDPLYLCLPSGGKLISGGNLYEIGPLLRCAGEACLSAGATPVFVHYTTKASGKKPESLTLDHLALAGIGEYARQWIMLSRTRSYQLGTGHHELLMSVGGNAGQSGSWNVIIDEGPLPANLAMRQWKVIVHEGSNLQEKQNDSNSRSVRPSARRFSLLHPNVLFRPSTSR